MSDRILYFSEYQQINEAFDIGFFRKFPIFKRALTNPFILKLAIPVIKLMNANPDDPKTWEDPYRAIFKQACIKFGGGRKPDINATCDKGKALMGIAKFLFDPQKGLIRKQDIDRWVDMTVGESDPEKKPKKWPYTPADIDDIVMKFVGLLERTKVKPADIKEVGTFLLEIGLPVMARFYKRGDLQRMKMITSNKLILPSSAAKLIKGKEEEPQAPGKEGEISIY